MAHATTLFIVMALAGGPVGSLACELWCSTPAAESHQRAVGCHDAEQARSGGPQLASTVGCHDVVAIAPFVTEARQTESAGVTAAPLALFDPGSIVADQGGTTEGWRVFSVRPPRPPSSPAVLRV